MREILFRGKRIDNGEWALGYVGVFKGTTQIFVPFTAEEEKENEGHIFSVIGGLWHTVDPSTVGQFTGVCDLAGKRIFEGDTVDAYGASGHYEERGVVNWNNLFSQWEVGKTTMYGKKTCSTYEIVGNIHDNPELRGVVNGSAD